MANYNCAYRTNYFRVTDEEKYQTLFAGITAEDCEDFSEEKDGVTYHGFGGYGYIGYCLSSEDDEDDIDVFFRGVQSILPDDEAIIFMESGHEKLRYVVGYCTVITNKDIKYLNLNRLGLDTAREMIGNPDWNTKMEY